MLRLNFLENEPWNEFEEMFFVLAGTPAVRTAVGEERLAPGDVVYFPEGPNGLHDFSNPTEEPARLLGISTKRFPDVVAYPERGVAWVATRHPERPVGEGADKGIIARFEMSPEQSDAQLGGHSRTLARATVIAQADGKMLSVNGRDRRAEARAVVSDALSGSLSLEDFHRRWPDAGDPLIDAIFDETEDTLEHTPGSLLTRGRDQERFQKSIPYKTLLVDEQLLLDDFAGVPSHRLLQIRERLLKEVGLDQDDEALSGAARDFVARELAGGAA